MPSIWVMRIMRIRTAHHGIILSRSVLLLRDFAIQLILITMPWKIHMVAAVQKAGSLGERLKMKKGYIYF